MGITMAPAFFWFMMQGVLTKVHLVIAVVYPNDVTVFGHTLPDCWVNSLAAVWHITASGMNLQPKKLKFLIDDLLVLGHQFRAGQFRPNEKKFLSLDQFEPPKMFKPLQALHGLLQYFKTYVAYYDELMVPTVTLLSAPCPEWTSDHTATVVLVVTAL